MTVADTVDKSETPPALPHGTHQFFLALSGAGFVVLVACLVAYGVFGARITAGLDEACAEAALVAGRKLEAAGNPTQAIQKYRQALNGTISDERERNQCGLAIGDILFRDGKYNEALAAYRQLPPAAFNTSGSYAGFVGTLWKLGESEEALRLSEPWLALALEDGNIEQEVWARKSLMRGAQGDIETTMEQCRLIIAVSPCDSVVLKLAGIEHAQGHHGGARQRLEEFLAACDSPSLKKSARSLLETWAAGTPPERES